MQRTRNLTETVQGTVLSTFDPRNGYVIPRQMYHTIALAIANNLHEANVFRCWHYYNADLNELDIVDKENNQMLLVTGDFTLTTEYDRSDWSKTGYISNKTIAINIYGLEIQTQPLYSEDEDEWDIAVVDEEILTDELKYVEICC